MEERARAFHMLEEFKAEPFAFGCAFDKARNVAMMSS